jgi:hypothetical protein
MSALKPTMKFPYLRAGSEIVGDHPQAREARRVYDYYKAPPYWGDPVA